MLCVVINYVNVYTFVDTRQCDGANNPQRAITISSGRFQHVRCFSENQFEWFIRDGTILYGKSTSIETAIAPQQYVQWCFLKSGLSQIIFFQWNMIHVTVGYLTGKCWPIEQQTTLAISFLFQNLSVFHVSKYWINLNAYRSFGCTKSINARPSHTSLGNPRLSVKFSVVDRITPSCIETAQQKLSCCNWKKQFM